MIHAPIPAIVSSGASAPDMLTGLESYWAMEQGSATTRLDSHASNDLLDTGAVARDTGRVSFGARFSPVDRLATAGAAPAALKLTGDKTFAFWYQHQTGGGSTDARLLGIDDQTNREYEFKRNATNLSFWAWTSTGVARVSWVFPTLVNLQWYFIVGRYDQGAKEISINMNNGALTHVRDVVQAGMKTSTSEKLEMGSVSGSSIRSLKGTLDEVGIWSLFHEDSAIDWLFNGGVGRTYSDFV